MQKLCLSFVIIIDIRCHKIDMDVVLLVERDGKGENGWNRRNGNRYMKYTKDRYFSMRFLSQRIYRMRRIYCRRHLSKHFFLMKKQEVSNTGL